MEPKLKFGQESMVLNEISIPQECMEDAPLPEDVESLIQSLESEQDSFFQAHSDSDYASFVPSDFRATYKALAWIKKTEQALGPQFCEWGSALGGVAILAASLGFRTCGIEVHRELVEQSRRIAEDLGVSIDFACGSFVPDDAHHLFDSADELDRLDISSVAAYEELGDDPDSFDLIFAYPWPSETQLFFNLFDHCAANGALLLSYHGEEGLRLHRRLAN